jgi:hypothetical protein
LVGVCVIRSKVPPRTIHGKRCKMDNFVREIFTLLLWRGWRLRRDALTRLFACIYPHIFAANFDWIAGHRDRWVGEELAGGDVVLPAMPGADDSIAF